MAHTHDVYDMENHFEINGSSRFIKETSETKLVVVQGDHKSEVLTFKMPRYIDGHDMTLCNKIRIHYINLDTRTNNKSADVYEVTDLTLCEECEDVLTFTWTIEAPATKYSGTLSFLVKFECTEGENVLYQWNTAKYVSVNVLDGIDNSEEFVEKYSNVLEEWYNELTRGADSIEELNQQAIAEIELAKEDAKEDIQGKAYATMAEMNQFSSNAYNSFKNDVDEKAARTLESIPEDYSDMDVEVKDIRVGANGKSYSSAGEAVREQIKQTQNLYTFKGFPTYNGYIFASGTWGSTLGNYKHIVIPVKKGQKLSVVSGEQVLHFACVTEYVDAVNGEALYLCSEAPWNARIEFFNNRSKEYTIPEDGKYLIFCIMENNVETLPLSFVIDGYEYCSSVMENIRSLNKQTLKITENHVITASELSNGLDIIIDWENGGFNRTDGSALSDFSHKTRKRSGYLVFPYQIKIVANGKYSVSVCLCDSDNNLIKYTDFSNGIYTIEKGTKFRLLMWDATSSSTDISAVTNEEINAEIVVSSDLAKNVINPNVRWCALGDSITQGYISRIDETTNQAIGEHNLYKGEGWATKLANRKQWELTNKAIGGTGYLFSTVTQGNAAWNVVQNIDFNNFDVVTIAYGTNDYNTQQVLGNFEDDFVTPISIYGAMRKTIETIIASNPLCKIIVITPLNAWWAGTEDTNWAIGQSKENVGTLEDVFYAIKTVCEYYGIEYIDMTHASIINRKNIQTCLLDKVHPTAEIHTVLARELAKKISFE